VQSGVGLKLVQGFEHCWVVRVSGKVVKKCCSSQSARPDSLIMVAGSCAASNYFIEGEQSIAGKHDRETAVAGAHRTETCRLHVNVSLSVC
jgi:hypothetical protein